MLRALSSKETPYAQRFLINSLRLRLSTNSAMLFKLILRSVSNPDNNHRHNFGQEHREYIGSEGEAVKV